MTEASNFLALGTISKSTLLATPTNNIELFPLQSDQTIPGLKWVAPERGDDSRPTLPRRTVMSDGSIRDDGFYSWSLYWSFWTFGQMGYWLTHFFTGPNVYANPGSAAVTTQTYMDTDYVCFQALMYRPKWKDHYKAQSGGYSNIIVPFAFGTIIT